MTIRSFNHRERLETCLAGGMLDRIPVALWRHFPVDDQNPDTLAAAVLHFQKTYDFDLVKVTPASSYCLRDWGVESEWRGNPEGTRDYTRNVIEKPEDWEVLKKLDPEDGCLGEQLRCLRSIVSELGSDVPVLETIFSPLAQAKNLAGRERLIIHLRRYPDAVHAGLETITQTTRAFIELAGKSGIAGIFYAVQHAQYGLLSVDEFDAFGTFYDLQVLEAAQSLWFNLLHLHGSDIMFDQPANYPIHAINWHDRDTYPSLREARERFGGVLCGGLRREKTMVLGTPDDVIEEAQDAIQASEGKKFILGTGCVLPITAPHGNILAARQSVETKH